MEENVDVKALSIRIGGAADNLQSARSSRERARDADIWALSYALTACARDVKLASRFDFPGVEACVVGARRMGFAPEEVVAIAAAISGYHSGVMTVAPELVTKLAEKALRIAKKLLVDAEVASAAGSQGRP